MWVTGPVCAPQLRGLRSRAGLVFPLAGIARGLVTVYGCQLGADKLVAARCAHSRLARRHNRRAGFPGHQGASLEVARQTSGHLDRSSVRTVSRSLVAMPAGGIASSLQIGTSRPWSRLAAAARKAAVIARADPWLGRVRESRLARLDPGSDRRGGWSVSRVYVRDGRPVAPLGATRLDRPRARHRHHEPSARAMATWLACWRLSCACLLFALELCARGVVRQHATRAEFASPWSRSAEAPSACLRGPVTRSRSTGSPGTSSSVRRRACSSASAATSRRSPPRRVAYVILDFGG